METEYAQVILKFNNKNSEEKNEELVDFNIEMDKLIESFSFDLPRWYRFYLEKSEILGLESEFFPSKEEGGFYENDDEYRLGILDIDGILKELSLLNESRKKWILDNRVIPFASDLFGSGDYFYLILNDDINKTKIIQLYHDAICEFGVISNNFIDFFNELEIYR